MDSWRKIQRNNFTKINDIVEFLEIKEPLKSRILTNSKFSLNLPVRLAQKIKKNTSDDPIFKQFIPINEEKVLDVNYVDDPVNDKSFCKASKLLQKYKHRALILCNSACAMHCRYCFRKNFPYENQVSGFDNELNIIANDLTINEVILSGGDPLSLSNSNLANLVDAISKIKHIKRIRFHTRFIIGIPERIDSGFIEILQKTPQQVYFVIHVNHPLELDDDVLSYLAKIQKLKIPILTQTVLLKGINDSISVLKTLCEKLIDNGIIPYYLHDLDQVKGTLHFKVSTEKGTQLIQKLREEISGYGVFQYVSEIPFKKSKTPVY